MNNILALTACTSILALGSFAAFADAVPTTCSLSTLRGTMAWGGTNIKSGVPRSSSGMESYDGSGRIKYFEYASDGYTTNTWTGTGTYTITANCVATVIYDGDPTDTWTFFVAPDGSAYYSNNNLNFGAVGGGRTDRISRTLLVQ